jgi:electron transport complex protein RnfG
MDTATDSSFLPQSEPGSFRLIATLGIAGFFSGLLLVGAFLYTQPIIQAHRAKALREAIFKVLPGSTRFETLELRGGELVVMKEEEGEVVKEKEVLPEVYAGFDEANKLVGFAIQGKEPGFQDIIVTIFGYQPEDKLIIGFEVLESKETPGLGDKIIKDQDWLENFIELSVEPSIAVVKKGAKQQANEVEAITGATISSKAVVRLLQKELAIWRPILEDYSKEIN